MGGGGGLTNLAVVIGSWALGKKGNKIEDKIQMGGKLSSTVWSKVWECEQGSALAVAWFRLPVPPCVCPNILSESPGFGGNFQSPAGWSGAVGLPRFHCPLSHLPQMVGREWAGFRAAGFPAAGFPAAGFSAVFCSVWKRCCQWSLTSAVWQMVPTAILMMLVKSAWVRYDDFHLGGAMLVSGYTLKGNSSSLRNPWSGTRGSRVGSDQSGSAELF